MRQSLSATPSRGFDRSDSLRKGCMGWMLGTARRARKVPEGSGGRSLIGTRKLPFGKYSPDAGAAVPKPRTLYSAHRARSPPKSFSSGFVANRTEWHTALSNAPRNPLAFPCSRRDVQGESLDIDSEPYVTDATRCDATLGFATNDNRVVPRGNYSYPSAAEQSTGEALISGSIGTELPRCEPRIELVGAHRRSLTSHRPLR